MKKRFQLLLAFLFLSFSTVTFAQGHCEISDLFLDGVTDIGNNQYQIDLTFCTKGGSNGFYDGVSQNTGTFGFILSGNHTLLSFPASLTSPQTGAVYNGFLYNTDTIVYDDQTYPLEWWTCIDGSCGLITTYCTSLSFVTNGLPESINIPGLEGGGNPAAGCTDYRMTVYPAGGGPDCSNLNAGIAASDTNVYLGWSATECVSLTATASGQIGDLHYQWSNGDCVNSIQVCPTQSTTYSLTITDQQTGCSTSAQVSVEVEDVRCGRRNEKIIICENGTTKCIRKNKVAGKLNNGATLGACNRSPEYDNYSQILTSSKSSFGDQLLVYPNPVVEAATIEVRTETAQDIDIFLVDLQGRIVQTFFRGTITAKEVHSFHLSSTTLNAGLYFLHIKGSKDLTKTQKVIIK